MKRLRSLMGAVTMGPRAAPNPGLLGSPGFWTGAAMLIAGAGCGQPFSSATGGTGGAGPGASTSGGSGSGGTVASTGSGAPKCTATSCSAGEYCDTSSSVCASCTNFERFQFGTPVATQVTVPAAGASALYPRPNQDTGGLYVVQQDAPTAAYQDQLALAPAPSPPMPGEPAWTTATLLSQFVGLYQDSGPLYLSAPMAMVLSGIVDDSVASSSSPVLLFDSNRTPGKRQVFAAILGASTAPSVVSLPGGATHASRVAISFAAASPHFWWISDAGAAAERLVTGTVAASTPVEMAITLDDGCPSPPADAPWVTPKGERLLFASAHTTASPACAPVDPTVTHLYQVPLTVDGMAMGKAQPVFANDANLDTTPALTTDLCALLFARFDTAGNGEIYEAPRN